MTLIRNQVKETPQTAENILTNADSSTISLVLVLFALIFFCFVFSFFLFFTFYLFFVSFSFHIELAVVVVVMMLLLKLLLNLQWLGLGLLFSWSFARSPPTGHRLLPRPGRRCTPRFRRSEFLASSLATCKCSSWFHYVSLCSSCVDGGRFRKFTIVDGLYRCWWRAVGSEYRFRIGAVEFLEYSDCTADCFRSFSPWED